MTVATVATRAAGTTGSRAGAGKVIDVTPSSSRPLRKANTGRDVATGAGLGQLASNLPGRSGSGRSGPGSTHRRILVAEFAACMVMLAFSPLADPDGTDKPVPFMKRASAIMALFFVLGLISTAGRGAGRAAAGLGGLVTLVLLINQRNVFTVLAAKLAPGVGETSGVHEAGEGVADALEDLADAVGPGATVGGTAGGVASPGVGLGQVVGGIVPLLPVPGSIR